jgi:SlyX protein
MPLNERVQLLEEKIAYLERHVTAQDKAMLELAEEIATLRRELKASRERSGTGAGGRPEGTGEEWGERPLHY